MDQRVDLAGFGVHVGERLAEMPRLRGEAVLLIEIEMGPDHARLDVIIAVIDQHAFLLSTAPPRGALEADIFRKRRRRGQGKGADHPCMASPQFTIGTVAIMEDVRRHDVA
jgi:hypothetical protein